MKTVKKVFATLLTLVMLVALALPAFAKGTTYTITIENTNANHTYSAYQVFSGDLTTDATTGASTLSNVKWGSGVNGENLLTALKASTDSALLNTESKSIFADCTTAADVAEVLSKNNTTAVAAAFANVAASNVSSTATATATGDSDTKKATISGLSAGYYLVTDSITETTGVSDALSKYILKVVESVTVQPKTDSPSVEKKVQENVKNLNSADTEDVYGDKYNDVADYNIGDNVPFRLIGTVPDMTNYESYSYIFHDTMSAGLTYDKSSVKVYLSANKVVDAADPEITSYFTVSDGTTDNNGGTAFAVACSDLLSINNINKTKSTDQYIIVAYTATLNSSAVIGLNGNPNEVYLEYSNNPNGSGTGTTPVDKVIVFTYELDTNKVDSENSETKLSGAEFVLYRKNSSTTEYAVVSDGKVTKWEEATTNDGTATYPNGSALTSDSSGLFKVAGLDDGTYYLKETKAPAGYNLLENDIVLKINATTANNQTWSGTASNALTALTIQHAESETDVASAQAENGVLGTGIVSLTVANNKGATLPSTGGIGTTIFYVLGGGMMLAAAVLLIAKKRVSGADK